jgi:hypothetical protein
MDFNNLYKKIADIDRTQVSENTDESCGATMPVNNPPSSPTQPMSMTVNLSAQGESDISSLMKLLTKVNPDMMPKVDPLPIVSPELSIGGPKPAIPSSSDDMKGDMMKLLPLDKKEDFRSATTEPNPEYKDIEYMTNKLAGGLNGPKGTYPKVSNGDNPMQKIAKEEVDLKSQIKADLARRLSEMKK